MSHLVGLEWVFRPINFAKISIYPLIHRLVGLLMRIFIRPGTDCCQNRLLPELETGRFLTHCCLSHKQDDGFLVGYGRYMWEYRICHTRYSGLNDPSLKSTQTSDANSLLKILIVEDRNIKIAIFATAESYCRQVSMRKLVLSKQIMPCEAVKYCCLNKLNPCKSCWFIGI